SAPPSVEWKAPGDPVTAADRAASAFIVENLERLFPGDAILSEEEPDDLKRLEHSRVWMVDPMDGTREFIAQRGEFAVMIGLVVLKGGVIGEGLGHLEWHAGSRTQVWDTCGPDAMLHAAGGRMTDARGAPLRYDQLEVRNLNGLVATNGIIHDRVVKVTQSVIAR